MSRESILKTRERRRKEGLCPVCGAVPEMGVRCNRCRKTNLERKQEAKLQGRCVDCHKPAAPGSSLCDHCNKIRKLRWHENKKDGLCGCGRKLEEEKKFKCCKDCRNSITRRRQLLKLAAFNAYGGPKCACCGDDILEFLTIDHIENNGAEHRRAIRREGFVHLYQWLKNNKYPPGYQVLCFNCNCGKRPDGTCPCGRRKIIRSSD